MMKLLLHLQENLEYFIYYVLIYRQSSNWLKSNLFIYFYVDDVDFIFSLFIFSVLLLITNHSMDSIYSQQMQNGYNHHDTFNISF